MLLCAICRLVRGGLMRCEKRVFVCAGTKRLKKDMSEFGSAELWKSCIRMMV